VGGVSPIPTPSPGTRGDATKGPSFLDTLSSLTPSALKPNASGLLQGVKFSNHAVERMRQRGISFSPDTMERISRAVDKAQAKGAKDTLVLADDSAMIVNVNSRTVVTVMDKQNLKENVFTNIDSTVVV
jgi:flagellar operon protein